VEAIVTVVALIVILGAAVLSFWAWWRYWTLTKRLHPFTPRQRQAMRRTFKLMVPMVAACVALVVAIGSGGTSRVVALGVIAAIVLLDAVLTPWLGYRRARRRKAQPDHDVPST
jgi:hypothetical protein